MLPIVVFGVPRSTEVISIHDLSASAPPTEILFFSFQENTHQSSAGLHSVLVAPMNAGGILMTFSANLGALSDSVLSAYDAVLMYENARTFGDSTAARQVPALERYVES